MAWTTPRTWTTSEIVTSGNFNLYIQQDLTVIGGCYVANMGASAAQTITQGSTAFLNASAVDDPAGLITGNGSVNCKFTIPAASLLPTTTRWQFGWATCFTNPGAAGSQDFRCEVYKNAVTDLSNRYAFERTTGGLVCMAGMDYASFANGDTIQLRLNNADAARGSIATVNDPNFNYIWIALVGWA